ncbi:MAG TPA: M56 family metallopeptidase, partial [Planctomycetaceae bacterium]|nr:M56 family metallopeptidase [Planctomycetaceae bacterium]
MNALGQALVWCALQVTLVAAAAGIVYVGLRRRGPAVRSLVALTALAVFVGLALAALSPWPRWTVVASARSGDSASAGSEREIARPADGTETPSLAAAPGGQAALAPSFIETAGSFWQAFVDELERRPIAAEHEPGVTGGTGWTWRSILAVLFAAGVALGGLRLIAAGLAVAAYRRFSRRVDDAQASRVAAQLCAELGCRRPVELRECPQLGSAAMLGWRRPLVLLPSGWRAWSEAELRAVLAHEIAHVRRGDFAAWALAQLGLILHFYHPLVHWLAARLRLDQELAADAAAAGVAGGRQPYLRILAEMALRQPD